MEGEDLYYSVRSVYYNGDGVADGYSSVDATVMGDDLVGIGWTMKKMKEALKKPILWGDHRFPAEYKE